jgi:soluble lytic murein transglycosylase
MIAAFPASATPPVQYKRLVTLAALKRMPEAKAAFDLVAANAAEKEEAYYQLVAGYAKARLFADARKYADEMRVKFPAGKFTPKAFVDAGYAARDARARSDESYFLNTAVVVFPNAVEVAGAQFELAWMQHESGNFSQSSQMFVDHLAKYADKDTTNRGKAGYWAARDSERAGKTADACALYEGVMYRYSANWYGHLAQQRLGVMKGRGECRSSQRGPQAAKAINSLKSITVAPETATERELDRAEKSEQLSVIGLFDWAINELEEAKKTAANSPKINLALAKHYRMKGDNVSAFLALGKSYPDYSQMFPEEMGPEEWDIFYPQIAWEQIVAWSKNRNLDLYQVAGLIRQESVFNPRAKSPANAYGLMQLILPTARSVARKYGSTATITVDALFQPALNIELGTAYMRDQLDKYGRIEYMAVAYNAGPGRVPQWRAALPIEMDEFVEAIPFRETKAYVQGVIRNSAQYRRLYDENGNFRSNVGSKPLRAAIDSLARDQLAVRYPEVVLETPGQ